MASAERPSTFCFCLGHQNERRPNPDPRVLQILKCSLLSCRCCKPRVLWSPRDPFGPGASCDSLCTAPGRTSWKGPGGLRWHQCSVLVTGSLRLLARPSHASHLKTAWNSTQGEGVPHLGLVGHKCNFQLPLNGMLTPFHLQFHVSPRQLMGSSNLSASQAKGNFEED